MATILCVDDDEYLTDLLTYALQRSGLKVLTAHSGRAALALVRQEAPDLVILDVNIPDMNGFKILSAIRAISHVPVVMLTARAQDEDVMTGLSSGADDYIIKPFSAQILVERVKAVMRRARPEATAWPGGTQTYRVGGAIFDVRTNAIAGPDGVQVRLTPTETKLLHLLFAHEGQVLSPERIMERVWGYNSDSDVNVIKTHIRRLREKIGTLPGQPQPIRTLPGAGYVIQQTDEHGRPVSPDYPA